MLFFHYKPFKPEKDEFTVLQHTGYANESDSNIVTLYTLTNKEIVFHRQRLFGLRDSCLTLSRIWLPHNQNMLEINGYGNNYILDVKYVFDFEINSIALTFKNRKSADIWKKSIYREALNYKEEALSDRYTRKAYYESNPKEHKRLKILKKRERRERRLAFKERHHILGCFIHSD